MTYPLTMVNDSNLRFGVDNEMRYLYSHNTKKINGRLEAHYIACNMMGRIDIT